MRASLFIFLLLVIVSIHGRAEAQALPFNALSGDSLPLTFQIESIGPTLSSERADENVTHLRGEVFVPIAQSDVDAYAIQLRGSRLTLDRDHTTTAPNGLIPRDLGSISVGPFFRRKLEGGDILAGDVQVGRSGIELGSSTTATTVSANMFWGRKKEEGGGQWIYLLSYSNSRSTFNNVPIPGFAYVKSFTSESSQGLWAAGAPFLFTMIRAKPWSFTSLITPFSSFIEGGYSIVGPISAFLRFGWQPQGFKVSGGPNERILYEEFRTQLGIRSPITKELMVNAGVAFCDGRRVTWSDSLFKSSGLESRLEDEWSLFLGLSGRF